MDRQKRPFTKIFVKVGAVCGWKKQHHKEEGEDILKVVTVLGVNKLYSRHAGTQV